MKPEIQTLSPKVLIILSEKNVRWIDDMKREA